MSLLKEGERFCKAMEEASERYCKAMEEASQG